MRSKDVEFVGEAGRSSEEREASGRRVATLGLVFAASGTIALVTSLLADAAGRSAAGRLVPAARPVAAAGIVLGMAVFALARAPQPWLRWSVLVAGFDVASAVIVSLIETLKPWSEGAGPGVPITSLWIVTCAMLVPLPPRQTLLVALAAAASGPIAATVLWLAGRPPSPSAFDQAVFFLPSFVAVAIATVGARIQAHVRVKARLLGSYRLVKKIGQGGMGEVWRAEHHLLAHPAAIKLVRPESIPAGDRPVILKRFEREAQMTANLTSPHTVDLYDYGVTDDGIVYYVMELIEGIDLERLIERHGPMPPARAVHFLRQTCHSLAEAHAAGLMHRDIKPSNLFCCRAGLEQDYIKVLDFGLVRPVAPIETFALTRKGVVMGTPGFIAPEVAQGKPGVDHRSDLYSLGCVGYYLLSGEHVFDVASPMRALHDHVYRKPIALRERAPRVPVPLEDVIMSCLVKDPGGRPADAETLAGLLARATPAPWEQEQARSWWSDHPAEATA